MNRGLGAAAYEAGGTSVTVTGSYKANIKVNIEVNGKVNVNASEAHSHKAAARPLFGETILLR